MWRCLALHPLRVEFPSTKCHGAKYSRYPGSGVFAQDRITKPAVTLPLYSYAMGREKSVKRNYLKNCAVSQINLFTISHTHLLCFPITDLLYSSLLDLWIRNRSRSKFLETPIHLISCLHSSTTPHPNNTSACSIPMLIHPSPFTPTPPHAPFPRSSPPPFPPPF